MRNSRNRSWMTLRGLCMVFLRVFFTYQSGYLGKRGPERFSKKNSSDSPLFQIVRMPGLRRTVGNLVPGLLGRETSSQNGRTIKDIPANLHIPFQHSFPAITTPHPPAGLVLLRFAS
ncbi:Hypothetical protein NTJ_13303 [Nesidiocoris tenuis]|uniref:Secreted protein n=1 Tax=Nesidiocoris tenuis TaxID=355587 RepID=A0ABN7B7X2_9HEMI|nr:Hypothetical protein NTJ_13303 [Nesidiocoris tenuis]